MMKTSLWFVAVLFASVYNESSAIWFSSSSKPVKSNGPRPRPGWPSFSQLESNYPRYDISWDQIVDDEGLVDKDGRGTLKEWSPKNGCAMRVSRALTHAGKTIVPQGDDLCDRGWLPNWIHSWLRGPYWSGVRDSQNRPYIVRVGHMRCYLENEYGPADVTGSSERSFRKHQGIIVFQDCTFSDATGHVDLWNGSSCLGACYWDCDDIKLFEF